MIIFNNIIKNFFFRLIYKPKKVTFDGNGTLHFFPFYIFGFISALQLRATKSDTIYGYNMVEEKVQKHYLF